MSDSITRFYTLIQIRLRLLSQRLPEIGLFTKNVDTVKTVVWRNLKSASKRIRLHAWKKWSPTCHWTNFTYDCQCGDFGISDLTLETFYQKHREVNFLRCNTIPKNPCSHYSRTFFNPCDIFCLACSRITKCLDYIVFVQLGLREKTCLCIRMAHLLSFYFSLIT